MNKEDESKEVLQYQDSNARIKFCNCEVEINDLRGRLDRRNALLDTIRKAYHRDVIAVKEFLTGLKNKGLIPSNNVVELMEENSLASLPSVDLRETFRLFAPHECDLKIHPCWYCGGKLEIIHRESSRIVNFKHTIQLLEEKESDLRIKLIEAKVKAKESHLHLTDALHKANDEREVLLEQISSLRNKVSDRNELAEEVEVLKNAKKKLEAEIEQQRPMLIAHEHLLIEREHSKEQEAEMTRKLLSQIDESEKLKRENDSLLKQLDYLNQDSHHLRTKLLSSTELYHHLEESYTTLTQEVLISRAATKQVEARLFTAEQSIQELKNELSQEKQKSEVEKNDLKFKCTELGNMVVELNQKVIKSAEEAAQYLKMIETILEGARQRGSIVSVPQSSEAAFAKTDELIRDTETLRQKATTLSHLLLSCIRSTYENCLIQEKMMSDYGSIFHEKRTQQESMNEKARIVLENLENSQESDVIDWVSTLANETDQRHVLGNLHNRLQMDQFQLSKCFDKIYKDHENEMRKCLKSHQKQMDEKTARIWELEKLLTASIRENRIYEEKMAKIQEKHESLELTQDFVQSLCHKIKKDYLGAIDVFRSLRFVCERLLEELVNSKYLINRMNASIFEKQEGIDTRDNAIKQLETLLENITHRYAENERLRIKITSDTSIQAVIETKDVSAMADFLPTPVRKTLSSSDHDNNSNDALLPGRIYHMADENWPHGHGSNCVTIGPTSAIQLRRAIDKL